MFTFTKLFWHNTQNQKPKLFSISIIGFVILLLLTILSMSPFNVLLQLWQFSVLSGNQNFTYLILMMVASIILTICLFTMLIFPFFVGVIQAIHHSIVDGYTLQWKNLVGAFKKGVWGKTVLTGVFVLLFIVFTLIVYALVNAGVTFLIQKLFNLIRSTNNGQSFLQLIISILIVIASFVSSIVVWLAGIYITHVAVSINEDATRSLKIHFKEAWRGMRNGHQTFFRFLLGLLLINLLFIIINEPVNFLIQQNLAHISQNIANTLSIVLSILLLLIRYFIYFILIGSIVQYFVRRGSQSPTL
ncbi:lytic transglycosylase [Staphylococcus lutrae]|uniref:Lytic transglycosylase n=1 Tax=Staphylococcus lutrae TaxID=155085 RepID=A0AAC9RSW7_9STAP|nr:lytic transglycosylase [Staphylococcus lutrae]ARJ50307.1 lytic transglycosylase [Staphylococcus lutrae]PNZ39970.1 lytic transglycosylase [Staphylococcus lutrae]